MGLMFFLKPGSVAVFSFLIVSVSRQLSVASFFHALTQWYGPDSMIMLAILKATIAIFGLFTYMLSTLTINVWDNNYDYVHVIFLFAIIPLFMQQHVFNY